MLPNESIRDGVFYAPATHGTNAGGSGEDALPCGARLRLKTDFDGIEPADFELLQLHSPAVPLTYACEQTAY